MHVRAYERNLERTHEHMAVHAAWIMNMWAKRGSSITADKLLGKEKQQPTAAELKRQLEEKARRNPRNRDRLPQLMASTRHIDFDSWKPSASLRVARIVRSLEVGEENEEDDDGSDGDTIIVEERS